MAKTQASKIDVKCNGRTEKAVAASTISPGRCVEMAASGKYAHMASTLAEYNKRGGLVLALGDASLTGKTVADDIAADGVLNVLHPLPGDIVLVEVASGEDISQGDNLVPTITTGLFTEAAGSESRYFLEAVESPGALAADTLVRCRVI